MKRRRTRCSHIYTILYYMTLTVRVELPDDGLYDSGALGDMSPAYWHAVTGGITHRASPPYSHVSGHAGAAGRVCGRPTALATGITGIIGFADDGRSFRDDCWRDGGSGGVVGDGFGFDGGDGRPTNVCAVSRRCSLRAVLDESVVVLALRGTAPAGVHQSAGSAATPPPSRLAIAPESYRTIYYTFM